ncbi:MAG: hypothetical protein RQ732_10610, partial [Methylophaga sp.]|nr:hypothetical protein [Methylophaga sp.]
PKWVYPNLIIQGHVAVYPAPPNGGKTTIFAWIAGQIANEYQVFYVNADISGGDSKDMQAQANEKGFKLLLPDMKAGLSMTDVVDNLEAMNALDNNYSSHVFIFDTLKKMTNVIQKDRAKNLYKTLRGLSAKGMTIILLAHTNKYNDADGVPIYEGTGDLRSDVDEMIYLIPKKNDDGSMTVSTKPDKVRGSFKPLTFNISSDRRVSLADEFVDVIDAMRYEHLVEEDEPIIQAIHEAIDNQKVNQTEIVSYCKSIGIAGTRKTTKVLERYSLPPIKLWNKQKAFENNAIQYFKVD